MTTTSRTHTISSVYYHIKIIVIKLLKVKLDASLENNTNKLLRILTIIVQNLNFSVNSEVLTRGEPPVIRNKNIRI